MMNNEPMVIQRAQKGDPLAFARLHDRYYPLIYRFFFYRIGDSSLAAELSESLFDRLVERIHLYKAESMKFLPWLYTLAKSLLMETLLARGLNYEQAMPPASTTPNSAALPADHLKAMLARLPSATRDVIVGKLIERRPTRGVAREIGRSAAVVRDLQHQGLEQLRRIQEKEGRP